MEKHPLAVEDFLPLTAHAGNPIPDSWSLPRSRGTAASGWCRGPAGSCSPGTPRLPRPFPGTALVTRDPRHQGAGSYFVWVQLLIPDIHGCPGMSQPGPKGWVCHCASILHAQWGSEQPGSGRGVNAPIATVHLEHPFCKNAHLYERTSRVFWGCGARERTRQTPRRRT